MTSSTEQVPHKVQEGKLLQLLWGVQSFSHGSCAASGGQHTHTAQLQHCYSSSSIRRWSHAQTQPGRMLIVVGGGAYLWCGLAELH